MGSIYPYLVRKEYLAYQANAGQLTIPLGHEIYLALVEELPGMVRSLSVERLRERQLSVDQARAQAINNLGKLFQARQIHAMSFPDGPEGKPFILVGGHWDAAACVVLPNILDFAQSGLKTEEDICFSIPHTEALLFFPKGDRPFRDAMRKVIRERESDGRKQLTFELFTFDGHKPVPMAEP